MASLDSIASLMADDGRAKPRRASRDLYATVRLQQDGSISVVVDGSSSEAPATAMVGVHHGDRVMCHIVDHSIVIFANVTAPTTDDSTALVAIDRADVAREAADAAGTAAAAAQDSADDAADAATAAQSSADQAGASARQAIADAAAANVAALSAQSSADQASQAAAVADGKAVAAGQAASSAQASATRANTAANDAFTQLSIVEDVSGTLSWIRDHGTYVATTDTSVQDGTVYFELVSGDYVPIAQPDPEANPRTEGWYVLDITDSQTDYIMAHLAVTSAGLWVLPSGLGQASSARYAPGYKVLLASDGMYLYDAQGHLVTTYGESITFDSSRPQYIGGESAYIAFYDSDDDGVPDSISIGGANVSIGGRTLSTVLADVATASQRAEAAMDICTIAITSTGGTVFKQDRGVSTTLVVTVFTGDGMRITDASALHTRFGNGAYLQWKWKDSPEDPFTTLLSSDPRIGAGGFTLTVSPSDISTQAVIDCELIF